MEIKQWKEYSESEKKELLYFWWRQSLNIFILDTTYADEQFEHIVEMDVDLVFATVVMLYFGRFNSKALFDIIMGGNLCQVLNKTLVYRTSFSEGNRFDEMSAEVLGFLVDEYNKAHEKTSESELGEAGDCQIS